MSILDERFFLFLACACYSTSFVVTYLDRILYQQRILIFSGLGGLLCHSVSLAMRWNRIDHGPFINLYEILSSNLWSLQLAYLLFLMLCQQYRSIGRYLVPLLAMLMLWLLISTPKDTFLPATYDTIWLYFHVFTGKLFLGLLMLASGMSIFEYVQSRPSGEKIALLAASTLSYRLLAFAFCFESLMLLFGAIWAQDAWGRYWAWDPLETWAFMTWLSVIFVLHWRLNYSNQGIYAGLVTGCFVLAFLTFFGVPFVSTAPHKGMI